jgi:hypothetical protein
MMKEWKNEPLTAHTAGTIFAGICMQHMHQQGQEQSKALVKVVLSK